MSGNHWPNGASGAHSAMSTFDWDDYFDSLDYDPSSALGCWEYADIAVDVPSLKALTDSLNDLGAQGWEVITTTMFPSITTNKMVVVAKRRLLSPRAPDDPAAGWRDDPTGRFDKRYWDGRFWSAHVGTIHPKSIEKDPPTMLPPPPDLDDGHKDRLPSS